MIFAGGVGGRCIAGLLAVSLAGCFGADAPRKGRLSALWLAPRSAAVDAGTLARLEALGLSELFVEAAALEWSGAEPRFVIGRLTPAARRLPVTLVVTGDWPAAELRPPHVSDRLHGEVDRLRIAAERAGLLAVGIHFDVAAPADRLESYGETLTRLRKSLEGRLFLSADVERQQLGDSRLAAVARGVDFLVCFLYGQRSGEREDPSAWDLQSVEGNVQLLERLARPYLLGAVTLGTATLRGRDGLARASGTEGDLRALVDNPKLELKPGFSLEGVDRQILEFVARSPTAVGGWSLAAGDSVRVVKTATPFLEEFLRRTGAWESPNRLGDLFYRQPAATERLSVGAAGLEAALAPSSAQPALALELERRFRSERSWRVRVRLRNTGSEPTDLAYFDTNYVELRIAGGTVGDVEPGEFRRFELLFEGTEKGTMRALRTPDTVRLFAPMVDGGEVYESGEVELRLGGPDPVLTISATFLLPEGRLLATEPVEWTFEEAP
jgi:hypothetical protein